MASGTTATSKVTPVTLGTSVKNKTQAFTATKVTETADSSGNKSYKVELVKYSDAKGTNPTVFGTRDANGKLTLNSNASAQDKQFVQQHLNASKTQMESVKNKFGLDAASKQTFEKANGSPNKAGTDNPAGDTEGATPFNAEEFSSNIKSTGRDNFKQNGVLVYPVDIGQTKQDVIKFDMLKYKPKQFSDTNFGFSNRERNFKTDSIGTVVLPMPSGISDTNSANWGSADMNAKDAELARMALSGITGGVEGAVDSATSTINKISESSGEVKTAVAAVFGEAATGIAGLLSRTTGTIINPNMELLFNGPSLRPFTFNFKMSARNQLRRNKL